MQDKNNENNNSRDSGDEILEILDNYRKKQTQNKSEEQFHERAASKPSKALEKSPVAGTKPISGTTPDSSTEKEENPRVFSSHLTDSSEHIQNDSAQQNLNPHLSDKVNLEELKNAQSIGKNERFQKEKKPAKKFFIALGNGSFLFKALFYIFFIILISAYLSYYIIAIGNDVFAFVKDPNEVTITIKDDTTADDVADMLAQNNLIRYEWVFKLYLNYRSDDNFKFLTGDHKLSSDMNYTQIIDKLTITTKQRVEVQVVIPEGYTTDQIIDLLIKNGVGTREKYVDAINNYDYKWEFVQALKTIGYSPNRKYRLDGYLFPNTYYFYTDMDEVMVINKFLDSFNANFWEDYKTDYLEACSTNGMKSFDDIITLASMVQAEGKKPEDFYYISAVFHNRLTSNTLKKLQSDATVLFTKLYIRGLEGNKLTAEDIAFKNPYNTYENELLPPGAICNPGLDAISAALYPSEPASGKSYFFVSNDAGKTYYAADKDTHAINKNKVAADNQKIADGTYVYE